MPRVTPRRSSAASRTTSRFEGRSRALAERRPTVQLGRYAAFISYRRRVDRERAIALQTALQQFDRSWYRQTALRVFRDDAVLAANPDLWLSVQAALDRSDYLILLASPAAATSEWIAREVGYWLEHKNPDDILIAVTSTEPTAEERQQILAGGPDSAVNKWAWLVPPALAERYGNGNEPRSVEFHELRPDQFTLRDPAFRELFLDLAARLHGRSKEELVAAENRQHIQRMRAVKAVGALLATLLLLVTTTAIVAFQQRSNALRHSTSPRPSSSRRSPS